MEIMWNCGLLTNQEFPTYNYDLNSFSKSRLQFAFLGCGCRVLPIWPRTFEDVCVFFISSIKWTISCSLQPDDQRCSSYACIRVRQLGYSVATIYHPLSWFPVLYLTSFLSVFAVEMLNVAKYFSWDVMYMLLLLGPLDLLNEMRKEEGFSLSYLSPLSFTNNVWAHYFLACVYCFNHYDTRSLSMYM